MNMRIFKDIVFTFVVLLVVVAWGTLIGRYIDTLWVVFVLSVIGGAIIGWASIVVRKRF